MPHCKSMEKRFNNLDSGWYIQSFEKVAKLESTLTEYGAQLLVQTRVHPVLAKCMQNIINNIELAPSFMLKGITYMLPTKPDAHNPSDIRPIACLQTIYRVLTAVISDKV